MAMPTRLPVLLQRRKSAAAGDATSADPAAPIALPSGDEAPAAAETNGKAQANGAAKTAPVEA